jgi:peptidoglycan hydrolase-like protein with peptidoglycan-binding domain
MQRIDITNGMKRRLTGSAFAVAFAITGLAQAEGKQSDAARPGDQPQAVHSDTSKRAPAGLWGLTREQIKDVQRELASRGFYQGTIDGIPGAKTDAALRNFQTQQGLATGGLTVQTRDALGLEWDRQPVSGTDDASSQKQGTQANKQAGERQSMAGTAQSQTAGGTAQASPKQAVRSSDGSTVDAQAGRNMESGKQLTELSTEQAKQIQQRLQSEGYYQGEVDGVVGAQTRVALRRYFQKQAQLADQGIVSDTTVKLFQTK